MYNALSADKIRDNFKAMKMEKRTPSDKLKSQMTSGDEGIDFICLWRFYWTLKPQKRLYISRSEIRL